jgi:hypothetical protein
MKPSSGIYYCLRFPAGWEIAAYRFDQYSEDLCHADIWEEEISKRLAGAWAESLRVTRETLFLSLRNLPYGFPRGRVAFAENKKWTIYHGKNLPVSVDKSQVEKTFSLLKPKWEWDEHEQCPFEDYSELRSLLRIQEEWMHIEQK